MTTSVKATRHEVYLPPRMTRAACQYLRTAKTLLLTESPTGLTVITLDTAAEFTSQLTVLISYCQQYTADPVIVVTSPCLFFTSKE